MPFRVNIGRVVNTTTPWLLNIFPLFFQNTVFQVFYLFWQNHLGIFRPSPPWDLLATSPSQNRPFGLFENKRRKGQNPTSLEGFVWKVIVTSHKVSGFCSLSARFLKPQRPDVVSIPVHFQSEHIERIPMLQSVDLDRFHSFWDDSKVSRGFGAGVFKVLHVDGWTPILETCGQLGSSKYSTSSFSTVPGSKPFTKASNVPRLKAVRTFLQLLSETKKCHMQKPCILVSLKACRKPAGLVVPSNYNAQRLPSPGKLRSSLNPLDIGRPGDVGGMVRLLGPVVNLLNVHPIQF